MRTIAPVVFVIALGLGALMWAGSGAGAVFDQSPADGLSSGEEINKSSQDAPGAGGELSGDASTEGDGDIIGLVLSGIGFITSIVSFLVLLPFELANLGLPFWFAGPVGAVCQLIGGIGLVQFATNRRYV